MKKQRAKQRTEFILPLIFIWQYVFVGHMITQCSVVSCNNRNVVGHSVTLTTAFGLFTIPTHSHNTERIVSVKIKNKLYHASHQKIIHLVSIGTKLIPNLLRKKKKQYIIQDIRIMHHIIRYACEVRLLVDRDTHCFHINLCIYCQYMCNAGNEG